EVDNRLVASGERPEFRDEVRVGKESDVEQHVQPSRRPVLEPERRDRYVHLGRAALIREALFDHVTQRVDIVLGRVDDNIGEVADFREQLSLVANRRNHILLRQRVWPARFAVAAQQDLIIGLKENDGELNTLSFQLTVNAGEHVQKLARANIDHKRSAVYLR